MTCPICKNTMGFVCGTCIECGYNSIDHEFHTIQVNVRELKMLLPDEIIDWLIEDHHMRKRR